LKSRTSSLIAITLIPVALVGALLWWVTGLVPECSNTVLSTLESPDASRSLVAFARQCGDGSLNTQAVVMPKGGTLESDATGFLALEGQQVLKARWDAYGNLEITIPPAAVILQQHDEAAGIAIIYN